MCAQNSEVFGLKHLPIDSTDRCKYSATFVDVFTHVFMLGFDLGTLIKTQQRNGVVVRQRVMLCVWVFFLGVRDFVRVYKILDLIAETSTIIGVMALLLVEVAILV